MAIRTKQVIECDDCGCDLTENDANRFPAGTTINGTRLSQSMDFCARCLGKRTGVKATREVVYVERDESSRGGGATGRPFSSVSRLIRTGDWCTLPRP